MLGSLESYEVDVSCVQTDFLTRTPYEVFVSNLLLTRQPATAAE